MMYLLPTQPFKCLKVLPTYTGDTEKDALLCLKLGKADLAKTIVASGGLYLF